MTKVLILLDGFYGFDASGSGATDFTFVRLVEILSNAGMAVTKAHRDTDASADIDNVTLAAAPNPANPSVINLLDYDVVWMFGAHGQSADGARNLGPTEVAAVEAFMDAGGGVFATGDHESIGADMCGRLPRVRLMRAWFGNGAFGNNSPMLGVPGFPRNFDQNDAGRADTLRRNPAGSYPTANRVWFENQSDSVPQPLSPTTAPAHPILRHNGRDLVVYADHMHEGQTLGVADLQGIFDYTSAFPLADGSGRSVIDFPALNGHRELPLVIATGHTVSPPTDLGNANTGNSYGQTPPSEKSINTLCVYDGAVVGKGRIVTASTFHHYIDINLDGTSGLGATGLANAGADAAKGKGFYGTPSAAGVYEDIKQVFINITNWLAKPRIKMELILERSTISQDEAIADADIEQAIVITIDGIRPNQFPNGPITSLGNPPQLATWAPAVTFPAGSGLRAVPTEVDSDDPSLADRLQRFTFTYRIEVEVAEAFDFAAERSEVQVEATFTPIGGATQSDFAVVQLVKSANPFMLDLANNNDVPWLSSDLRVFAVVAGQTMYGKLLPVDADRTQALTFLEQLVDAMSIAQFESLAITQEGSKLRPMPTTTPTGPKVYNFAVARVRLNGNAAIANNLRVFFRIFTSQTTAALQFNRNMSGPTGGYLQTGGAAPIALPSPDSSGSEWLSIPMFAAARNATPSSQQDTENVRASFGPAGGSQISTFFGALIDSNLDDPALPQTPNGGPVTSIRDLLMSEHQCIVAQVEYAGTPIPSGSGPSTSDKLSQRNIAFTEVANPGTDASRAAIHTFEIEATRGAISEAFPPDELVLRWRKQAPDGTRVQLFIPTWDAQAVVDLAERYYARHEITVVDKHTISVPAGGTRYVPVPASKSRQTGVLSAHLPLGITKGQRFDLSVRQITNQTRGLEIPGTKTKQIPLDKAAALLRERKLLDADSGKKPGKLPMGVFDLGDRTTLVTDLRVLDMAGEFAVILEAPHRKEVEEAKRRNGRWRRLVGAFQLAIPVSTKAHMLNDFLRLLSVLQWRLEKLPARNRWVATMTRYVEMTAQKVRALGGRPEMVPATPDGRFDLESAGGAKPDAGDAGPGGVKPGGVKPGGVEPGGNPGGTLDDDPSAFEPTEDWLGNPGPTTAHLWSGKVSGLLFDHFGDFEGFTLEDSQGRHVRFFSRESAILALAQTSWKERYVVTVVSVSKTNRTVVRLLLRGYH
ncbi:MAG: hypothetical protein JNK05_36520 [Myxococcales bacterium]|nr:hypothetical protein [Myxococcales bacterium]